MADIPYIRPKSDFLQEMNQAFDTSYRARLSPHPSNGPIVSMEKAESAAVTFAFMVAKETTSTVLHETESFDSSQFRVHSDLVAIIDHLADTWMPIAELQLPESPQDLKRFVGTLVNDLSNFPDPVETGEMDYKAREFYQNTIEHFRAIKVFFDERVQL